jgi:hypothetical protein
MISSSSGVLLVFTSFFKEESGLTVETPFAVDVDMNEVPDEDAS